MIEMSSFLTLVLYFICGFRLFSSSHGFVDFSRPFTGVEQLALFFRSSLLEKVIST